MIAFPKWTQVIICIEWINYVGQYFKLYSPGLHRMYVGYSQWKCKLSVELSRSKVDAGQRDVAKGFITQKTLQKYVMDYRFTMMYLAYQQAKIST